MPNKCLTWYRVIYEFFGGYFVWERYILCDSDIFGWIRFQIYFLAPPQIGNPLVLMQIAVRLKVDVVKMKLVRVDTPNASKKRFASAPFGRENPGWISNGIITSSETDLTGTSSTGSALK